MVRVLLCDDHPIFREGLKKILAQYPDVSVVGEVGTGAELMELLQRILCDVIILDISLPDTNGLDVLKRLQDMHRTPASIMLSMHPEEQYAIRALKAGARGYLEKASVPGELITALRKVASGGRYVSPTLAERLASELAGGAEKLPHEKLSDREYQVMLSLAAGKGNKQIAKDLFLSRPTIATYRSRVLQKLKLRTTADLIHYALQHRLIE